MATKKQWIIGGAVVVGLFLVYSEGSSQSGGISSGPEPSGVDASRSCTVTVTADSLPVRSGPNNNDPVVETLIRGSEVLAERTTQDGFRQLGQGRWAAQKDLDPTPGSDCG